MKVVVFGATGTIGAALVTALTSDHDVTAVSRSPQESRDGRGVRWVRADVDDEQSVARAMEGAEVAYYLVHSLGQAGFEERERRSADGFARAAEKSGLHQIVYLGGLGDDADDLSPHLRSRRETEQRLAARSVPVTTLRASMVIGEGSAAFETIAALVDRPACDDPSALGQNADTADCARRRRPFISPESAQTRTYSGRPMTLAGPRS